MKIRYKSEHKTVWAYAEGGPHNEAAAARIHHARGCLWAIGHIQLAMANYDD